MKNYSLNDLIVSKNQGINTTTEKIKYTASGHIVLRAKNILDGKIDLSDIVFVDDDTYSKSNDIFKPNINDVLYTNIGSQFGNSCVVKCKDLFITWNILRLTPKTSIVLPDYLSYLLKMNRERLRNLNSSSTMPFVSGYVLGQQIFLVHELPMQQHIVDTIGSIDNLIEKYNEILSKLLKCKSLYYKKSLVNASELSLLKDYITIETGSMNLNENNPNGKYVFYTRNEETFKSDKYTHDQEGVIVAGEGNFMPKYANGRFGLHQRAYLICSNNKLFSNKVLFQIFRSNVNYLNGIAVGSTVKSLRKNSFENMPFYVDGNYNIIEEKLNRIQSLEDKYNTLLDKLSSLKHYYLRKYFG